MKKFPAIVLGLLASALFASCGPSLPPVTVKFPDGKNSVEIPFTRYRNWIIVKTLINGRKELSFILDTGAPIALLGNAGLADELDLHISGNVNLKGSDDNNPKSVPLADDVTFKIGELEIRGGLMAVGAAGDVIAGVDGVIGKCLFEQAVVSIDWNEHTIVLTKPDNFTYEGAGEILPLEVGKSGHIFTEMSIKKNGREMRLKANIDSGRRSAFTMDQHASASIPRDEATLSNILIGRGANGPIYGNVSRINVNLGSIHMGNVLVEIKGSAEDMEPGDVHARIGLGILDRFNLVIDYPNQRMILEKTEHVQDAFSFSQTGIILGPLTSKEYLLSATSSPARRLLKTDCRKGIGSCPSTEKQSLICR